MVLLWLLGIHFCFLPWALGAMEWWGQAVSLGLAAATLAVAIRTREYSGDAAGGAFPYCMAMWPRLLKFPIFWLGLGLLAHIAFQALNPSWRYVRTPQYWWLVRLRETPWLPTGISAPFERFNAWRQGMIYASAWLSVCAVWVGCTRRRSLRIILEVIIGNATALVLLLAVQRMTGNENIPWPLTSLTPNRLTASFVYENHAGGYFVLAALAAIALATWFFVNGEKTLVKSSPAAVLVFLAVGLSGAVLFTLSRGASLSLALSLLFFAVWFFLRRRFKPLESAMMSPISKMLLAVFLFFGLVTLRYLDFDVIYGRFEQFAVQRAQEPSVHSRVLARAAADDMLADHWLRGVGAGGFRYLFPEYVKKYPEIYDNGNLFWEHAHCDWLEIPIELGLVGDLLIVAGAAWWAYLFMRNKVLWNPLAVPLLLGCVQTLVHAGFDFPLQCPAVLATWCVLIAVAGRCVQIETGA